MFSYYGSKSKVVHLYPPPKYAKIYEPFAGSARYSLRYFDREVTLVDKYEVIVRIWKYLQSCSKKDILGLPKLELGMDVSTLNISDDEKLFMGMLAGVASISPRNKVSAFSALQNGRERRMNRIADQLFKIKHWKIIHGSYTDLPNDEGTYFIDAPYQVGGHAYKESEINFNHLAEWSQSRQGQIIVCENTKADWLPFVPMSILYGAMSVTEEAIWTNYLRAPRMIQQTLL